MKALQSTQTDDAVIADFKAALARFLQFPNTAAWAQLTDAMQGYSDAFHDAEEQDTIRRAHERWEEK
ncbi:hypothetical protein LCGC14_2358120 [marine sediment metagenome]|uniref:Uncharacterized protein n=1 Tax=marine sediment metagenome TaxID=412755 RepID=A0A0F9F295_9ZZZZ